MNQEELKEFHELEVDVKRVFYVLCDKNAFGDGISRVRLAYRNNECDSLRFVDDGCVLANIAKTEAGKQRLKNNVAHAFITDLLDWHRSYYITALVGLDEKKPYFLAPYQGCPDEGYEGYDPSDMATSFDGDIIFEGGRFHHDTLFKLKFTGFQESSNKIFHLFSEFIDQDIQKDKVKVGALVAFQNNINSEIMKSTQQRITQENIYKF